MASEEENEENSNDSCSSNKSQETEADFDLSKLPRNCSERIFELWKEAEPPEESQEYEQTENQTQTVGRGGRPDTASVKVGKQKRE